MDPNQFPTLRTRLAIVLIVVAGLFGAGVSSLLYFNFKNELRNSLRHRLENIAALAGMQQSGDDFQKVQRENDQYFLKIQAQNINIRSLDSDLRFVYTMRKDAQGRIYFVVDAGHPSDQGYSPFGTIYESPGPALVANFDTLNKVVIEPDFYKDEYGQFLSAYAPIYASDGKKVGVLGVDITVSTIIKQEQSYLIRIIVLNVVSLLALILFAILFADYLAKPIVSLRDMANKISRGDLNTRVIDFPKTRELADLAVDLNLMTANLSGLINDLEMKVDERTAELTKNTEQLRAASYIARQTADVQDLSIILEIVVNLVTDQFGFYHAGIFLMNETSEEVILQAASSAGGKRMLERGYSLVIGSQGIIGYVSAQKRARIALDLGPDAVHFNNPDLPMTRSEIALPLVIRDKLLGVLDVHSDQPQAFGPQDIDILQTLADQVAVAIDNARLLGDTQAALMQLEAVSTVRTRDAWNQKLQEQSRAFTYTPLGLRAEGPSADTEEGHLKAPIVLRGHKIGAITLKRKDNSNWNKLDADLINEVASQVALATDNLRLLEDAQQRARQEQTIGELATRFSQSLDIDSLLQTAARELGQLPDVAEVSVFIGQLPEQAPQKRRKRPTG
jgi:GAF domain-containing protein